MAVASTSFSGRALVVTPEGTRLRAGLPLRASVSPRRWRLVFSWSVQCSGLVSGNSRSPLKRAAIGRRAVVVSVATPEASIPMTQEDGEENEEDDYPLFMEEDDPTWPEGEDDGYGFQVSQFFESFGKPTIKNVEDEGSDDEGTADEQLSLNWEQEEYEWIVREINSLEWELVALQDPTPLILLGFERYGSSGEECWKLLKELEAMVKMILDSRKYPVRAVKLDVGMEQDLGAALKIKECPTLLFINAGKLVYRLTGMKTADELLQITSHLFYHSTRPACMDDVRTSTTVACMSKFL